jgi:hypothetical protein
MTLPAVSSWNVRGLEGPAYKVGPRCSNPNCGRIAEHAHHIVRRSQLRKQPQDWVAIDGHVIANKTGLCVPCHDDITGRVGGHKAAIRWIDQKFVWCLLGPGEGDARYLPVAPIEPQPPTPDQLAERAPDAEETGPEECPYCGHSTRRRRPSAQVGRRRRKRWGVLVPDEDLEQGADVLDALIDSLAPLVPNADSSATGRYYVLVPALAYAVMNGEEFVASFTGRGG